MALEDDLYTLLSTNPAVLAAMNGQNHVYCGAIPKGEPDSLAIVIQVTYTERHKAADATLNLMMKRVQFDAYAARYTDMLALSNAVRDLVIDLKGGLTAAIVQGVIPRRDTWTCPRSPARAVMCSGGCSKWTSGIPNSFVAVS